MFKDKYLTYDVEGDYWEEIDCGTAMELEKISKWPLSTYKKLKKLEQENKELKNKILLTGEIK